MNIFKATQDFEQWLAKRLPVVRRDLALKHALMAKAHFPFSVPHFTAGFSIGQTSAMRQRRRR